MEISIWAVGGAAALILALFCKIMLMRASAREMKEGLREKLDTQTNTPLTISSRDRAMRELALAINVELRELRSQRHYYEQGNAALRETVTNLSHDIRTPLTAVYGYLELLEGEEKSAQAEKYLAIIRNRTEILRQLTEELFVYATAAWAEETGTRQAGGGSCPGRLDEDVTINQVLEESISAYYGALTGRGIIPEISMTETKVIRRLNSAAFTRVLSNILDNAVKYSDGDLTICLSDDGEVRFSNHAAALNEVEVGRMFGRFYTVENAVHATGLGLSIARVLMERMGGSITARYVEGVLEVTLRFE